VIHLLVFRLTAFLTVLGWILILAGAVPVVIGHLYVGIRSHLPSVRDKLVQHGIYACVRHPIYAGGLVVMPGLALIRPSLTILVASTLVFAWLFVQAHLEEIDLVQRIPEYREYMLQVPLIPRFRQKVSK
jgi:protein-S-isoprenylcysteine O-methyltransferase Ste14